MNNSFRPEQDYWDHKLSCYLHDPPDKALHIPGHEDRSNALLEALGDLPSLDKNLYQRADMIASGMDRGIFPGHVRNDDTKNGAVDFLKDPKLTHPSGAEQPLELDLSGCRELSNINKSILQLLKADLDGDGTYQGLCSPFKGNPVAFSAARFHYVHHLLRERLSMENIGNLGGLWHRLPAETRMPDHSIWHHCGLVSALSSCFGDSSSGQASIVVFSITPVQDFIARARKLKDFWAGSLILAWLAFEGIREIIYQFGSDHILYPSLIGQPMVNRLFHDECGFAAVNLPETWLKESGIASFPNKFVFLAPSGTEAKIVEGIQHRIQTAWKDLGRSVLGRIENVVEEKDKAIEEIFNRQMEHFWAFHWAACPLQDVSKKESISRLLPESVWKRPIGWIGDSKNLPYASKGEGPLYQVTHALVQSFLAACKLRKEDNRPKEDGIKCQLHGDMECLRFDHQKAGGDKNPKAGEDPFWKKFRSQWHPRTDFKKTERLGAVAMVKRIAGHVTEEMKAHPLAPLFASRKRFPSTTEVALTDWLLQIEAAIPEVKKQLGGAWKSKIAQYVHETEAETKEEVAGIEISELREEERIICRQIIDGANQDRKTKILDPDRYFAIVLMDGDKMGCLVNGETLGSTWKSVLHPSLSKRLEKPDFDPKFRAFWKNRLAEKRLLSPSVHAAISEALGDFALCTVPAIIEKHRGTLIYAGGDDVCAVMPVSSALVAAREIAEAWNYGFVTLNSEGDVHPLSGSWQPGKERLAVHLGKGKDISISAGILIAHHKRPLASAIHRAHQVLDMAKQQGGRNAVAIELAKRSGGNRLFISRWDETPLKSLELAAPYNAQPLVNHFVAIAQGFGSADRPLSGSLIYRLEDFRSGLETLLHMSPNKVARFLESQIKRARSEKNEKNIAMHAARLAALLARGHNACEPKIETESLPMARFIGPAMSRVKGEVPHGN